MAKQQHDRAVIKRRRREAEELTRLELQETPEAHAQRLVASGLAPRTILDLTPQRPRRVPAG